MRLRTHTALTLLRRHYVIHPWQAWQYIRVQTRLYGIAWMIGKRKWKGVN